MPAATVESPYWTVAEFAAYARASRWTVEEWLRSHQLKAYRTGRKWLIKKEDGIRFIERRVV